MRGNRDGQTARRLRRPAAGARALPDPLPTGVTIEREGPVVRTFGFGHHGWVEYRDLADLGRAELDRLIQAQIAGSRSAMSPSSGSSTVTTVLPFWRSGSLLPVSSRRKWRPSSSPTQPPCRMMLLLPRASYSGRLATGVISSTSASSRLRRGATAAKAGTRPPSSRNSPPIRLAWRYSSRRRTASSSLRGGCDSRAAPSLRRFGVGRRCPHGAGAASIARSYAAARNWQPSGDGATWRLTLRRTADRSRAARLPGGHAHTAVRVVAPIIRPR